MNSRTEISIGDPNRCRAVKAFAAERASTNGLEGWECCRHSSHALPIRRRRVAVAGSMSAESDCTKTTPGRPGSDSTSRDPLPGIGNPDSCPVRFRCARPGSRAACGMLRELIVADWMRWRAGSILPLRPRCRVRTLRDRPRLNPSPKSWNCTSQGVRRWTAAGPPPS